jgi:thioredoxin 1
MKKQFSRFVLTMALLIVAMSYGFAQTNVDPAEAAKKFAPLQQWKQAIIARDAAALKVLYSVNPPATGNQDALVLNADSDAKFWLDLKAKSIKLDVVRFAEHPDRISVIFHADVQTGADGKTVSITNAQGWKKQGDDWRILGIERTVAPQLKQPADMKKDLYPENADAHAEIKEAEEKAVQHHKRLLLVFGANWCYDCHVLDLAFHSPEFSPAVSGYEVIHVDLGPDEKKNADLVKQYEIPLDKGIPALAVVDSEGKLIVSQKNGEFENARDLTRQALLEFLNKWKPEAR